MKFQDLTGQRFGKLTVIERAENKGKQTMWLCRCDCGNFCKVSGGNLKSRDRRGCGCIRGKTIKHGMITNCLYNIWCKMKTRCYNKNDKYYRYYGGRGIIVCEEWKNDFVPFYNWAIANGYKEEKLPNGKNKWTIDRIDNNGNYEPTNCRWVDIKTQCYNRRTNIVATINNESKYMYDWAEISGISIKTLYARYKKGIRGKDLLKPLRGSDKNDKND